MARNRYSPNCPVWGPYHDHYYADEETGEYRPFCDCGQTDPSWHDPELTPARAYKWDPSDPENEPPLSEPIVLPLPGPGA